MRYHQVDLGQVRKEIEMIDVLPKEEKLRLLNAMEDELFEAQIRVARDYNDPYSYAYVTRQWERAKAKRTPTFPPSSK